MDALIDKGISKPGRPANLLPQGCVSADVVARCPGWEGRRDDQSGQWLGSRTKAAPPGDRPAVVTAPDEDALVEAVEREMFLDLAAWYGAAWDLGHMANGRFSAARPGTVNAPPLVLHAETVAGLAALLADSARQATAGRRRPAPPRG